MPQKTAGSRDYPKILKSTLLSNLRNKSLVLVVRLSYTILYLRIYEASAALILQCTAYPCLHIVRQHLLLG